MLKYMRKLSLLAFVMLSIIMLASCATRHPKSQSSPTPTPPPKKVQYVQQTIPKKYADNSKLAKKVRSKLAADKEMKNLPITVLTNKNDAVELSGFVANEDQKRKAVELTQQVHEVSAVLDALLVRKEEALGQATDTDAEEHV